MIGYLALFFIVTLVFGEETSYETDYKTVSTTVIFPNYHRYFNTSSVWTNSSSTSTETHTNTETHIYTTTTTTAAAANTYSEITHITSEASTHSTIEEAITHSEITTAIPANPTSFPSPICNAFTTTIYAPVSIKTVTETTTITTGEPIKSSSSISSQTKQTTEHKKSEDKVETRTDYYTYTYTYA
ncbi:uncharacterized protein SPAPADRAFT_63495, partial [Spathaspora passalidarum NRRL Y-27907]